MNQSNDSNATTPWPMSWDPFYDHLKIRTYDHVLAWIFILGTVAGVLGNSCSVCFFWPRRKKTIHDMLYLTITAVDLITVSSSFPLIASLLKDRYPILFGNKVFCGVWIALVTINMKISIFLATIICVTRTMIMKYPKRPINRSFIIGAIIGYFIFLVLFDMMYILKKWSAFEYQANISCCWILYLVEFKYATYLGIIFQAVTLFFPSLIVFICFIAGIRILMTRPDLSNENRKGFRRVSITISIFTAFFLFFNIPCFIRQMWNVLESFGLKSAFNILFSYDKLAGSYYIELISMILPMFLNAVTNPLLYILRMKEYQIWIHMLIRL